MGVSKRNLLRCVLLTASTLAALALAEGLLRARSPAATRYEVWWPYLRKELHPVQGVMPGVDGKKQFVINSLGLRGSELQPEDTFRVLAVGGSTTECLFLDQAEAWPERVRHILQASGKVGGAWVGNAGKSGLNTRDHVVQMRCLVPQLGELDLDVVVYLVGINDLTLRLATHEAYDPQELERPEVVRQLVDRVFQRVPLFEERRAPLWKNSALYATIGRICDRHFCEPVVLDEVGRAHDGWRANRASAARILDVLPDLTSALGEFRRNLHELIDLTSTISPRTVFLTQPSIWRDDLTEEEDASLWLGGIGDFMVEKGCDYYSLVALREGLGRYNASTVQVAHERRVEVVALADQIPHDSLHFYDDVHFNENGSALVAEVVANYLLSKPTSD